MTFATYAFIVKRYWNRELKSQDYEGETYACWRDGNLFSRRHRPGSKRLVAGQRRLAPFDPRPSERPKNQKCQRPNAMVRVKLFTGCLSRFFPLKKMSLPKYIILRVCYVFLDMKF